VSSRARRGATVAGWGSRALPRSVMSALSCAGTTEGKIAVSVRADVGCAPWDGRDPRWGRQRATRRDASRAAAAPRRRWDGCNGLAGRNLNRAEFGAAGGRSALGAPRDPPAETCAQSGRRVCGREHGELQDCPGTVRRAGARARRSRNTTTSREPVADDWTALVRECLVARGKRVFPGTAQLVHAKAPLVLSGLSPEPGGEVVPAACVGGRRFRRDPSAERRAPS
jgi:hypothetical protein